MDNPAIQGLITIIVGVGGCIGYFYFSLLLFCSCCPVPVASAAGECHTSKNVTAMTLGGG